MRLWSIHPVYLDTKGLLGLWRESLLAQAVLRGETKGYKHHPQLQRFTTDNIGTYLSYVWAEGSQRGFNLDKTKIHNPNENADKIIVTNDQLTFEMGHLISKLEKRLTISQQEEWWTAFNDAAVTSHPLFSVVRGPIEPWEKIK